MHLFLLGEEPFQNGGNLWNVHSGDLPDNFQIDVGIIMRYKVSHAAHFSKGELIDGLSRSVAQMRSGLADDFDTPDHRVLLLEIRAKGALRRVFNVRGNESSRIQNVTKAAELVSFHTSTRRWPGCAHERSGLAIFRGMDARQNQPGDLPILLPRLPFPAAQ